MTVADLNLFFERGWNAHDLDVLKTFMTEDCVFETASGPDACGTRFSGRQRVLEAFGGIFRAFPDVAFRDVRSTVAGDRGVSEWVFTGTAADGTKVEVNGCDLFTFRDGRIAVKSSFLKHRRAG